MTQNNTSAVEISTIISDLNKHFASMMVNKDKGRGIPSIIKTIVELGAENVFYMNRDYHGLYEDDYCSFFYWDNVNGKVIEDYQIHYCNPKYIQLVEGDELVEGYIQWATDIINEVVEKNKYSSFFDMKDVDWEIKREDFSFESYVERHSDSMVEYLIRTAYDAKAEEEKKMLAAKRAEQYSSILEWVKTKTDKTTTSEQVALATKVLFKKY